MLKHNKRRNSHLLKEFLTREIAKLVIDNKDPKQVIELTKKYFASGTMLCEEDNLFNVILKCRKDRNVITKVLDEIKKFANKIDEKKLDTEKTKLIEDARKLGCEKMYNHKVKDYKLFASIQMFINSARNKGINESLDGIHLEENIINLLLNENVDDSGRYTGKQPNFHFLMMVDSITEDLKKVPQSQKELILKYLDVPQNGDFSFIDKKLAENVKIIENSVNKFGEDTNKKMRVFVGKIKEAKNCSMKDKLITLLESQELCDELVVAVK